MTSVEESYTKVERAYPFAVPAPGSPEIDKLINSEIEVTNEFKVPTDAVNGQTLHLILEAWDNGEKPLTSYKRVVLTV